MYSHVEPLSVVFALIQQKRGYIVDFLLAVALSILIVYLSVRVPVLIAFVLSLHSLKIHVEAFLLGCSVTEMKKHLCVEAGLEARLPLGMVIVEIRIEVGNLFVCEIAGAHAVLEHNSLGGIMIHCLVVLLLTSVSKTRDSHSLLLGVRYAVELVAF